MRNPATPFYNALVDAKNNGIIPRRFVWIRARNRVTNAIQGYGFWNGDDDVTVTVRDGQTGLNVSRFYEGMGSSLKVGNIPRVTNLTVQTVEIIMSQLDETVQDMFRNRTIRLAAVDIHDGLLSTESRNLVSNPEVSFLGQVDGDPVSTPAAGGEGGISISIVSDAIRTLTRRNPAKSSNETQKRRGGDEFNLYASVVGRWPIKWGEGDAPVDSGRGGSADKGGRG